MWRDLAALDLDHLDRPGAVAALAVGPVLAEDRPSRWPSGSRREAAPSRGSPCRCRGTSCARSVAALQPHRHRAACEIDASSCSSDTRLVDVVALERVDVAGQQRPLVVGEPVGGGGGAVDGEVASGERGASPLQRAVDRGDRGARAARPPRSPASTAPRAGSARPAGAEAGAGGRRRRPAGSSRGATARWAGSASDRVTAAVGHRLEPGRVGQHVLAARCWPAPGWTGPSAARGGAAAQRVEADVGGDAVEPGPQRGAALETVERLPGPYERLLHGVVGVEGRAEHAVAVAGQLTAVGLERTPVELRRVDSQAVSVMPVAFPRRPAVGSEDALTSVRPLRSVTASLPGRV